MIVDCDCLAFPSAVDLPAIVTSPFGVNVVVVSFVVPAVKAVSFPTCHCPPFIIINGNTYATAVLVVQLISNPLALNPTKSASCAQLPSAPLHSDIHFD